jgi:hypothetical protein
MCFEAIQILIEFGFNKALSGNTAYADKEDETKNFVHDVILVL